MKTTFVLATVCCCLAATLVKPAAGQDEFPLKEVREFVPDDERAQRGSTEAKLSYARWVEARHMHAVIRALVEGGRSDFGENIAASQRVFQAKWDCAANARERRAIIDSVLSEAKDMEQTAQARFEAQSGTILDVLLARIHRLRLLHEFEPTSRAEAAKQWSAAALEYEKGVDLAQSGGRLPWQTSFQAARLVAEAKCAATNDPAERAKAWAAYVSRVRSLADGVAAMHEAAAIDSLAFAEARYRVADAEFHERLDALRTRGERQPLEDRQLQALQQARLQAIDEELEICDELIAIGRGASDMRLDALRRRTKVLLEGSRSAKERVSAWAAWHQAALQAKADAEKQASAGAIGSHQVHRARYFALDGELNLHRARFHAARE